MRRRLLGAAAGILVVGALAAPPAGASDEIAEWKDPPLVTPSYAGDFPDPYVLVDDGRYWAYATGSGGRNLQVIASDDLEHWTEPEDPLPELPAWAEPGHTWAPATAEVGDRFVMYYTVRHTASGRQCISVATADTPGGPFTDTSDGPLVCQLERTGSIDPNLVADVVDDGGGGDRYLIWKSDDNATGKPTSLWAQRLSADGTELLGAPSHLLEASARWHRGIIEGPAMVATEQGYVLFYGAGDWWSAFAGIGYATCETPLGPCTDRTTRAPWLGATIGALGPSGPAPFVDRDGNLRFAYHAWTEAIGYEHGGVRSLFIGTLHVDRRGRPVLR